MRKFVVDHHRNLALEIPKVLARRVRAKGDELKEQFQEIARGLLVEVLCRESAVELDSVFTLLKMDPRLKQLLESATSIEDSGALMPAIQGACLIPHAAHARARHARSTTRAR